MDFTPSGMDQTPAFPPGQQTRVSMSFEKSTPSWAENASLPAPTSNATSLVQQPNASVPMFVTLSETATFVSPLHP